MAQGDHLICCVAELVDLDSNVFPVLVEVDEHLADAIVAPVRPPLELRSQRLELYIDVEPGDEPFYVAVVEGLGQSADRCMVLRCHGVLSIPEDYRAEAEEFRELDGERVLVLQSYSGRGASSGVEIEQMGSKGAALFHLRGGKVTRLVLYTDRERALADLDLTTE